VFQPPEGVFQPPEGVFQPPEGVFQPPDFRPLKQVLTDPSGLSGAAQPRRLLGVGLALL